MKTDWKLNGIVFLISAAILLPIAMSSCAPAGDNVANNTKPTTTPTPSSSPSPTGTPVCDNAKISKKLANLFKNDNQFAEIKKTVNFFAKDCDVVVMGYTKNLNNFKKFTNWARDNGKDDSLKSLTLGFNDQHLYLTLAEYPYGAPPEGGQCSSPYKNCGDICIPENDTCWDTLVDAAVVTPSGTPSGSPTVSPTSSPGGKP